MKKYVFLVTVLHEGYGGLEHCASSVVHCKREHLPKLGDVKVSDGYRTLLGLLSHEYFHTWNVKRIKPCAFLPYNLTCENYTRQLWIFEGITAYYDDLALIRTKRISKESYLELLGQLCTRFYSTPARFKQTLEQASFEAWTKFYKPDENSLNTTISYYTKGALVALTLDLLLRQETNNQCSLDTVMQVIWQRFGLTEHGLPEGAFEKIAAEVSGCSLKVFFDKSLSVEELSIATYLGAAGIIVNTFPAASVEEIGGKKSAELLNNPGSPLLEVKLKSGTSEVNIASVFEGGAAEAAGLAPGDIIVAVNGFKVDRSRFETTIANYAVGEEVLLHVFRREELMTFKIILRGGWLQTYSLTISSTLTEQQQVLLNGWLDIPGMPATGVSA
jgi:predicted metalloprotease with PDZ domain